MQCGCTALCGHLAVTLQVRRKGGRVGGGCAHTTNLLGDQLPIACVQWRSFEQCVPVSLDEISERVSSWLNVLP